MEEGYFDYDLENNIEMVLENGSTRLGLCKDIVENNLQFRECINTGVYFHISQRKALELLQKKLLVQKLKIV